MMEYVFAGLAGASANLVFQIVLPGPDLFRRRQCAAIALIGTFIFARLAGGI